MMNIKHVFTLLFLSSQLILFGQIRTPDTSPASSLEQTIGFTNAKIEYNRPQLKGRNMFKDLTREGEVWRTGANTSTRLTLSDELIIEGHKLAAGNYSFYSISGKKEWTIIINKKIGWGTQYDQNEDVIRITVPTLKSKKTESFTFYFSDVTEDSGVLGFKWGKKKVELDLTVNITEKIKKHINEVMAHESTAQNGDFYAAADYYIKKGLDAKKALGWATTFANKSGDQYWAHGLKARAQANAGMYKEAIITAKKVVDLAKTAGNPDYVLNFGNFIKEWSKK